MAGTTATVVLDGVDITDFATVGSVTHRLSRVSQAQIKVNMTDLAALYGTTMPGAGSLVKIYFTTPPGAAVLHHHGRVMQREVTATEDTGYVIFNSSDPLELWTYRPVRDDDGDFTKPTVIDTYLYGPQIMEAVFNNSIDTTIGGGGPPPADAEGALFLALGTVEAGTASLNGAPVDWPMTMAELAALFVSTGTLDIVVVPIETDINGNIGTLSLYKGDHGTDRTATVKFQYGMGAFNVQSLRWNEDMSDVCNKLWYYLGPRISTPRDYQGDQHWAANVTGDDPSLAYPPGGATSPPHSATNNVVGVARYFSQQHFGVRMEVKIYDGDAVAAHRLLYRRLWQLESYLRAAPRTLVHVTPARDTEIGTFTVGDLVLVEADSDVYGGFSGGQRVYEFTIGWNEDSVVGIDELQVSSDAEGF